MNSETVSVNATLATISALIQKKVNDGILSSAETAEIIENL